MHPARKSLSITSQSPIGVWWCGVAIPFDVSREGIALIYANHSDTILSCRKSEISVRWQARRLCRNWKEKVSLVTSFHYIKTYWEFNCFTSDPQSVSSSTTRKKSQNCIKRTSHSFIQSTRSARAMQQENIQQHKQKLITQAKFSSHLSCLELLLASKRGAIFVTVCMVSTNSSKNTYLSVHLERKREWDSKSNRALLCIVYGEHIHHIICAHSIACAGEYYHRTEQNTYLLFTQTLPQLHVLLFVWCLLLAGATYDLDGMSTARAYL